MKINLNSIKYNYKSDQENTLRENYDDFRKIDNKNYVDDKKVKKDINNDSEIRSNYNNEVFNNLNKVFNNSYRNEIPELESFLMSLQNDIDNDNNKKSNNDNLVKNKYSEFFPPNLNYRLKERNNFMKKEVDILADREVLRKSIEKNRENEEYSLVDKNKKQFIYKNTEIEKKEFPSKHEHYHNFVNRKKQDIDDSSVDEVFDIKNFHTDYVLNSILENYREFLKMTKFKYKENLQVNKTINFMIEEDKQLEAKRILVSEDFLNGVNNKIKNIDLQNKQNEEKLLENIFLSNNNELQEINESQYDYDFKKDKDGNIIKKKKLNKHYNNYSNLKNSLIFIDLNALGKKKHC